MTAVLRASDLAVRFGGVQALAGVELEVAGGQLVGLIGPNGAGKTTFIDAVTGFVGYEGRVELDGRDLSGLPPHVRAQAGLARTWQSTELFDDLSVAENITVASPRPSGWQAGRELLGFSRSAAAVVAESLDLVELGWAAERMPGELTQSQRKLVGVARAVAMRPRVLCLDEPAAGLDETESEELGRCLRRLVDGGTTLLLIDHDMGLVLGICDDIYVLEFGKVIASGSPATVRQDPAVVTAYLGASADDLDEATGGPTV